MSKRRQMFMSCTAFVLGCSLLSGCGDPPAESLPGHPVKGKVTVNGKELGTYCSIEFVSVSNPSETGNAGAEPSGNYGGRVPLGKCKVALKVGGPQGGGSGGSSNPYAKGGAGFSKGPTGPPQGSGGNSSGATAPPLMKGAEIPKKFMDVKTSGVEVTVVEGQDLDIDFK